MSDEFDPQAAARAAAGETAGGGAPSPGGRDQASADADVDEDQGDEEESSAMGMGALLLPLFLAPERGPTAQTFNDYGVDGGISMILDGITDYVLDLLGKDVEDNLGPAGKIGLGVTQLRESATGSSGDDSSDGGDGGDDDLPDEAPAPPGGVPSA